MTLALYLTVWLLWTICISATATVICRGPDLVLLDINLPKISGHDVLKVVKDDDNLKQIPVVMLSSSTADSDIERSFDLNANGYIPKPYDIDGFKTVVCEVQKLFNSWGEQPAS